MGKINNGYLSHNINYQNSLSFVHCGIKENKPNELCGPIVRDFYLLHFVIEGKGRYFVNDTIYHLKKGDVFAIYPNDVVSYVADENDPWYFCWIGFIGKNAIECYEQIGFKENTFVKHLDNNIFFGGVVNCLDYIDQNNQYNLSALRLNAFVLEILSAFQTQKPSDLKNYVDNAILYMEMNYNKKINLQDIAKHVGLEYSYFYRIFKNETNVSPIEYLTTLRIEKSKKLLDIHTPIKNLPELIGISDVQYFTKLFKKHTGLTPGQYIKN